MSGTPTLRQLMIFLICLTISPTMTQGRLSTEEHVERLLYIRDNDDCKPILHEPVGTLCPKALHHFLMLPKTYRWECPNAREAACREVDGAAKCTFKCDLTDDEMIVAAQMRNSDEETIKTLWTVTLPFRIDIRENEEEKHQRNKRQQQREEIQKQRLHQKTMRRRGKIEEKRQQYFEQRQKSLPPEAQWTPRGQPRKQPQQQPWQQPQQYQLQQPSMQKQPGSPQQFQSEKKEETRARRRQRSDTIKEKRSQ